MQIEPRNISPPYPYLSSMNIHSRVCSHSVSMLQIYNLDLDKHVAYSSFLLPS